MADSTDTVETTDPPSNRDRLVGMFTDGFGVLAVRCFQLLVVLAVATLVVIAGIQLSVVVVPVLLALILAAAIRPFTRRLMQVMPRLLATLVTLLIGAVIAALVMWLIVATVSRELPLLVRSVNAGIQQLDDLVASLPFNISQDQLTQARDAVVGFVTSSGFGRGALSGVSTAGTVIAGLVLTVVILFFFLKDGDRIWAFLISPFKGRNYDRFARIGETSSRTLGGYVRGTATVALVDTIGISIGMIALQIPLAVPLAVIIFIGAFIPLVGATVTGFLAVLVALVTQGWVPALILLAVIIAVNQLEGNLLQPVVMAQSVSLNPLVVLCALTAGTVLGGILGALLSVPTAAVVWAIMKTWNDTGRVSRDGIRIQEQSEVNKRKWRQNLLRLRDGFASLFSGEYNTEKALHARERAGDVDQSSPQSESNR